MKFGWSGGPAGSGTEQLVLGHFDMPRLERDDVASNQIDDQDSQEAAEIFHISWYELLAACWEVNVGAKSGFSGVNRQFWGMTR